MRATFMPFISRIIENSCFYDTKLEFYSLRVQILMCKSSLTVLALQILEIITAKTTNFGE